MFLLARVVPYSSEVQQPMRCGCPGQPSAHTGLHRITVSWDVPVVRIEG